MLHAPVPTYRQTDVVSHPLPGAGHDRPRPLPLNTPHKVDPSPSFQLCYKTVPFPATSSFYDRPAPRTFHSPGTWFTHALRQVQRVNPEALPRDNNVVTLSWLFLFVSRRRTKLTIITTAAFHIFQPQKVSEHKWTKRGMDLISIFIRTPRRAPCQSTNRKSKTVLHPGLVLCIYVWGNESVNHAAEWMVEGGGDEPESKPMAVFKSHFSRAR